MSYEYKIGTTRGGMQLLSALGIPAPHQNFVPHSQTRVTGTGATKGVGWAQDEWYWGFLTLTQRSALRSVVPDTGAHIFVRDLKDNGSTWKDFECEAEWPVQEDRQAHVTMSFTLKLKAMIELT